MCSDRKNDIFEGKEKPESSVAVAHSKKSLLSCAASRLDQGLSLFFKITHYVHKTSYSPEDASIVNSVYKHIFTIKKKPTSNIHSDRERGIEMA